MPRFTNINGLLAFVTVAREGSVSAAAELLNLTQPAVSHQLKRLSEDINVALFRRTSKGLHLTAEGAKLLAKAERVIESTEDFHRSARMQAARVAGRIRIGTIVDPAFIRLGTLLSQLKRDYPDIQTEILHGMSGETRARLKRKQIDAGFYLCDPNEVDDIGTSADEPLYVKKLSVFQYRVIGPAGWDRQLEGANWAELSAMPWIGTPELSVHHRLLKPIFEAHGVTQNVVALVDQEASMLEMVRSGVGLSLSRDAIALEQRHSAGLSICSNISVPACLCFLILDSVDREPVKKALAETVQLIWHAGSARDPK